MPMTPLAFIDQYLARYQSHNPALWNYEDGCVLTGCRQLYQATGEEKYLRFVLDYLDARVAADGTIPPLTPATTISTPSTAARRSSWPGTPRGKRSTARPWTFTPGG